jgi:transcription antitermination factor NusG
MTTANWYALQVYTGREKWVTSCLQELGYETLLLVSNVISQWSDRRKTLERAMFPGYVFCHFDSCYRSSLLAAPGVLRVVGRGNTPVPVEKHEIASLQQIARASYSVNPYPYLETGDWVSIVGGSLDGLVGRLVEFKKDARVVISVSLLQRSVCIEVDRQRLQPLHPTASPAMEISARQPGKVA